MKSVENSTKSLKLKSSISFNKALSDYFAYKSKNKSDLEHYEKKWTVYTILSRSKNQEARH